MEHDLGRTLRALREARQMSLKDLADAAGVSESFVSQIERGAANPSVASLRRLAEALDTSVGALFEGPKNASKLIRAAERPKLVHPKLGWEDSLITPRGAQRLQVIHSQIHPGGGSGDEPYSHDSDEECVVVLSGRLEMNVAGEVFLLEQGDSLTFESRLPHSNTNPGPDETEVLWIITPPSY